jgi:16S rRNA (guanine527-N7)-methyltransferase
MTHNHGPSKNDEILIPGAAALGFDLPGDQAAILLEYCAYLMFWNDIAGLTSHKKKRDILIYMFLDSLACVPFLAPLGKASVLDLGTGGGFPLLPCSVVLPLLQPVLLDSSSKKAEFLSHLVTKLGMAEVEVLERRVEDIEYSHREKFDIVCTRAYASLTVFLAAAAPLVRGGGRLCAWKGPRFEEELENSRPVMEKEGLELEKLYRYNLPFTERKGIIVVVRKKSSPGNPVMSPSR